MTGGHAPESVREHAEWVAGDPFARSLGVELVEVAPGYGKVAMTVRDDMLNSHDTAHGGAVFSLADAAFAVASNSHGPLAVALEISVNYIAPAHPGDRLVAEAREESLGRRIGVYRLHVTREDGTLVAVAQATAYRKTEVKTVEERTCRPQNE
jgi:acyl-CoA thioesterase